MSGELIKLRPRVVVVGCSSMKLDRPAPARELYAASPLFRLSIAWAEAMGADDVFVASAKHGLLATKRNGVAVDDVVEPYDLTIHKLDAARRALWGRLAVGELAACTWWPSRLVLLVGDAYAAPLRPDLRALRSDAKFPWPEAEEPLRGLQVGERLHWLKEALRAQEAVPC